MASREGSLIRTGDLGVQYKASAGQTAQIFTGSMNPGLRYSDEKEYAGIRYAFIDDLSKSAVSYFRAGDFNQ